MKDIVHRWRGPSNSQGAPEAQRAAGDAARDARNWPKAEATYCEYLQQEPRDSAIWVQYGHALKEQGKLAEAEASYRRSLSLSPNDADGYLQLGHVLKLQSRANEAADAYARSLQLEPTRSAYEELQHFGRVPDLEVTSDRPLVKTSSDLFIFELDDLIGYLRAHGTVSGIQRVQIGIINNLLQIMEEGSPAEYVFVRNDVDSQTLWQLELSIVKNLIDHCNGELKDRLHVLSILDRLELTARFLQPPSGCCYFVMGAFWGFNGDAARYAKLRSQGISVGVYIYDLIPLSHPEYCDAGLVSDFFLSFCEGLAVFDFILTISEFSGQEVRNYIEKYKLRPRPVRSVPLSHVLGHSTAHNNTNNMTLSSSLKTLLGRSFVLMVSTIEARKNHLYLLTVWRLLIQEGLTMPDLVFVGRHGWRVNDLMEQLRATDYMSGQVHVMHDLSDIEMRMLYENCLFTAFPSFVEGWGLPVGESLAHGQVCVASNTSSIPEVGGELVEYIDPYNVRDGLVMFRRLLLDDSYREERRKAIRRDFKARSWREVTEELLHAIAQHRPDTVDHWQSPLLRPGELLRPGDLRLGKSIPEGYAARPIRLILAEGWYTAEQFGVWMRGKQATLRFMTDLEVGCEIVAYLQLACAPAYSGAALTISSVDPFSITQQIRSFPPQTLLASVSLPILAGQKLSTRLLGRVDRRGEAVFGFTVTGDVPCVSNDDRRRLSVGLITFAYAARADAATRADIIDSMDVMNS